MLASNQDSFVSSTRKAKHPSVAAFTQPAGQASPSVDETNEDPGLVLVVDGPLVVCPPDHHVISTTAI